MKRTLLSFLLSLLFSAIYGQETGVPFRVGNKFGVADTNGKMLIPAKYDIVEPKEHNNNRYMTAYTFSGDTALSTLIINNKIVLKNKAHTSYYITNGLIEAYTYKVLIKSASHSDKNFRETVHLYDLKGNSIFPSDYKSISIIDEMDETKKLDAFLIYTYDQNNYETLYLYDKKSRTITRVFIDHVKSLKLNFNWEYNFSNRTITATYIDKSGAGKEMILGISGNTIAVQSEKNIDLAAQKEGREPGYGLDVVESPLGLISSPAAPVNSKEEKIITTVRKMKRKRGFYYLPKQIEELEIANETLQKDNSYVVSKNGKQGLFVTHNNSYIVPVAYDEIIFADFECQHGGYVLKDNNKYGLFIYDHPDHKTIVPVFDHIPLMVDYDYFGPKAPLLKLYDEKGKLLCYANERGKLFYKP